MFENPRPSKLVSSSIASWKFPNDTNLYPQYYFQKIQSAYFTLCIVLLVSLSGLRLFHQLACVLNDEIALCEVSLCHHASTLAPAEVL